MFSEIDLSNLVLSSKNVRKVLEIDQDETTIQNLAESIKSHGLINPLTVIKKDTKYEVIAGQRRLLALKHLNVATVNCNILENIDAVQAELISFTENIQRNKMAQQDKCFYFDKINKLCKGKVSDVAKLTGYSVNTIKDYIFINENLNNELFSKLDMKGESKLSMEIASFICKNIPKENQVEVYDSLLPFGTVEMKKQEILKFVQKDEEEIHEETKETKEKETKEEETEKKKKIPKEPWVFDENGEPLIIPKFLYPEICNLIKSNI